MQARSPMKMRRSRASADSDRSGLVHVVCVCFMHALCACYANFMRMVGLSVMGVWWLPWVITITYEYALVGDAEDGVPGEEGLVGSWERDERDGGWEVGSWEVRDGSWEVGKMDLLVCGDVMLTGWYWVE
ncbi:hypothetical protein OCU04_005841 [Sclerotinia nivalis]|uniref:Uncharacterized protein n=1 Tax=Sclerotinia nivalis TaxID=352851 RepID=A0A9X0AQ77_9HELO|nr:hypothetical protein OCU04_005841 [Sclerotinia nivalis]